jgi:hypothetical protein
MENLRRRQCHADRPGHQGEEQYQRTAAATREQSQRLFACSCVRRAWGPTNTMLGRAVVTSEAFADGKVRLKELEEIGQRIQLVVNSWAQMETGRLEAARLLCSTNPEDLALAAETATAAMGWFKGTDVSILRDVGTFHEPTTPWTGWGEPIHGLAVAANKERMNICSRHNAKGYSKGCPHCGGGSFLDPDRLAVLADALEEDGCQQEILLAHLRGLEPCRCYSGSGGPAGCQICTGEGGPGPGWQYLRGPHVRGCWALDHVLGLPHYQQSKTNP